MFEETNLDQDIIQRLDQRLSTASSAGRYRLSTYIQRYLSPLMVRDLFYQEQLGILTQEQSVERATIVITDVRGFTSQTLRSEQIGRGTRAVVELLERFFNDAMAIVFEYEGVMGEFSGDRFMAVFGLPFARADDADRGVLAAIDIYRNAIGHNRVLGLTNPQHADFEVGIGVHTGGPIWVGDIGARWRRELFMVGTAINVTARVEELTKEDEIRQVVGYNIIVTQPCIDSLDSETKANLDLIPLLPRELRGLPGQTYRMHKLIRSNLRHHALRSRIDESSLAEMRAIAQIIETTPERESRTYLQETMRGVGRAITSSLNLDVILESVLDEIQRFLNATTASILLLEEGTNFLRFKAVRPRESLNILQSEQNLVKGKGIAGYVAEKGESIFIPDAQSDPRFYPQVDKKTHFQTRSVLCTPILISEVVVGVIQVLDDHASRFTRDDLKTLETIAAFTGSAISNARQHEFLGEAETLAAISILANDLAHQVNSDVALIQEIARSLLETVDSDKPPLEITCPYGDLKGILQKVESVLKTMQDIRYPFTPIKTEQIEVRDLLEAELLAAQKEFDQEGKVKIKRRYEDVPNIVTDKERFSQVFGKIINNAFRAMADSEQRILSLDIWQNEPLRVMIGIADTGPGIPPEFRNQAFHLARYAKGRWIGQDQGWGYGLPSSRLMINTLGGNISLDPVYPRGTRILIALPLEPEPTDKNFTLSS